MERTLRASRGALEPLYRELISSNDDLLPLNSSLKYFRTSYLEEVSYVRSLHLRRYEIPIPVVEGIDIGEARRR